MQQETRYHIRDSTCYSSSEAAAFHRFLYIVVDHSDAFHFAAAFEIQPDDDLIIELILTQFVKKKLI